MTVKEFLKSTIKGDRTLNFQDIRPSIECNDGFVVSVQASKTHYCKPRANWLEEYDEVELGYPTEAEESIIEYAEDPDEPTNTVYGYVPIEIVEEVIKKHGGIKGPKKRYSGEL